MRSERVPVVAPFAPVASNVWAWPCADAKPKTPACATAARHHALMTTQRTTHAPGGTTAVLSPAVVFTSSYTSTRKLSPLVT